MKCFYHNDLDGRCAGSIVAQFENNYNRCDFFEVDYVTKLPLDVIQEGEKVYFVDYSFTKDTVWQLEAILKITNDVVWIDHHTSSINIEKELPWTSEIKGLRAERRSGAALTYMYLHDKFDIKDCPYYVQLVSDYDCWLYKLEPDTTFFKIGIETKKYDVLDDIWENLIRNGAAPIIELGKVIKSYIDNDNTYYREHFAYESEIAGHKCLVVNRKTNSWVFGEKYNEYPLVMVWVFDGDQYTYSIFSSNKDIDCSKIAESYGGGGHKGAAGFSSAELLFKKV